MASEPARTNTIAGELHQICAYVEATNTRIRYLNQILEASPTDEIIDIKRGLKNAHRGLEELQPKFRGRPSLGALVNITREVWQTYQRCRKLEERLREMRDTPSLHGERDGALPPVAYIPSGADVMEHEEKYILRYLEEQKEPNGEEEKLMSGALLEQPFEGGKVKERQLMSGALWDEEFQNELEYQALDAVPVPNGEVEIQTNKHLSINSEGNTTLSDTIFIVHRSKQMRYPWPLPNKTREEVLGSIDKEEEVFDSIALHDPDRVREGSLSGWLAALAINSGLDDRRYILPRFSAMKLHEVRELKNWLVERKFLHRSEGISRIEKVFHLLFLLQMGCRFETLAVLFSRSPKQVKRSCNDVFEALLEMHSESMLPNSRELFLYDYSRFWKIIRKYVNHHDRMRFGQYYSWSAQDLLKVIETLNIYIGRYRKQGHFALEGPILEWAKFVQCQQDVEE